MELPAARTQTGRAIRSRGPLDPLPGPAPDAVDRGTRRPERHARPLTAWLTTLSTGEPASPSWSRTRGRAQANRAAPPARGPHPARLEQAARSPARSLPRRRRGALAAAANAEVTVPSAAAPDLDADLAPAAVLAAIALVASGAYLAREVHAPLVLVDGSRAEAVGVAGALGVFGAAVVVDAPLALTRAVGRRQDGLPPERYTAKGRQTTHETVDHPAPGSARGDGLGEPVELQGVHAHAPLRRRRTGP